ncbi:MAG: hypothetical protein JRN09_05920 [Nitrososphaerota archaeon]|nr:hypothetical protein [Nitrososphaerota archaeon]
MELSAEAHVPAAISNFFTIGDFSLDRLSPASDLHQVGAMGGGFMLSRGVRTRVTVSRSPDGRPRIARLVVDGDPGYRAMTTRMAIEMLLNDLPDRGLSLTIEQRMEVPVGQGFGASAASALSAVNALSAALELGKSKAEIAYYAHAADIICRTGLGTVSVIYRYGGAGVIVKPGSPGVAVVKNVPVPDDARVVTASLAPYEKSVILSSHEMKARVNRLGAQALDASSALTLESLVHAGEAFADGLGLESADVSRLLKTARTSGAMGASQNMVGHAIHAIVPEREVVRVAAALRSDPSSPTVNVYDFGAGPSS